jgi:hypothetical protein
VIIDFLKDAKTKKLGPQIRAPLPTTLTLPSNPINSNYKRMQIDSMRYRPLTQDEKDCCQHEGLYYIVEKKDIWHANIKINKEVI